MIPLLVGFVLGVFALAAAQELRATARARRTAPAVPPSTVHVWLVRADRDARADITRAIERDDTRMN